MKLSPNELCECGSGKKYKKCCWLKDRVQEADAAVENRIAAATDAVEDAPSPAKPPAKPPVPQNRGRGAPVTRSSAPRRRAI